MMGQEKEDFLVMFVILVNQMYLITPKHVYKSHSNSDVYPEALSVN